MTSKASQAQRMIAYAQRHGSITTAEAVYNLGILSPTRRVCDIRKLGYRVDKTREKIVNQFGETCQIVRYKFSKEEQQ